MYTFLTELQKRPDGLINSSVTARSSLAGEYYAKVVGPYKETPEYLVKIHDYLAKHFPKESAKILLMHEMYKK